MNKDYSSDRAPRRGRAVRHKKLRYCAVLVDFENVYYTLANGFGEEESLDDPVVDDQALDDGVELLSNLRVRLREKYNGIMAIGRSYADFDRVGGDAQRQLQLLAFEPRFMVASKQKSSSDILLSIDAMEMLLTRPELDMFVIVGGDRDYLPVVRRIREHLKRVVLVGFKNSTSGDLRQVVGEENFIAAEYLLPEDAAPVEEAPRSNNNGNGYSDSRDDDDDYEDDHEAGGAASADEDLKLCMEELLGAYYQYGERKVWLTPFLRILNDRFPYLDNRGRKRLVEDLQAKGAIRIDKIEGDPYPYSVVEINWEDDWVRTMDEARGNV